MKDKDRKNIAIIGAGISGLSIANLLKDKFNVTIYEKSEITGGIARTKIVDNIPYHTVGGHCLSSKNQEALDFVFKYLTRDQWRLISRKSYAYYKNHYIKYPIEYSIKEIAKFDKSLSLKMTEDFFRKNSDKKSRSLADWFVNNFGTTLASEYFIPYNSKIWNRDIRKMESSWVQGKMPIASNLDFFEGLIGDKFDDMPHAHFYYPKDSNLTLVDKLSENLNIQTGTPVNSIEAFGKNDWEINAKDRYEIVINTSPLNVLPKIIKNTPKTIIEASACLDYNVVTSSLWTTKNPPDATWVYYPDPKIRFHRIILIGNFLDPTKNYAIAEIIGKVKKNELVQAAKKISYLNNLIDFNTSQQAYVVFDKNTEKSKQTIFKYLNDINLYTLGRFGEWNYYNMDICISRSIELAKLIKKKYLM